MNKAITQATQNDKQISKSIKKRFFTRFHVISIALDFECLLLDGRMEVRSYR